MRFDEDDARAIGSTLQAVRRAVGLTQEEMAERCEVSASTYARHESGDDAPSARLMVRYSRELGLLQAEFFQVHDELQKARRRVRQGASWWRGLDRETLKANDRAVQDRRLMDQFSQTASRLLDAMHRRLNQGGRPHGCSSAAASSERSSRASRRKRETVRPAVRPTRPSPVRSAS